MASRHSRGGTLEPLNPKHIQARVRAGASAETVAAETGWPLDRVIRYAGPPLAERAYVAERASSVEIRRDPSGQSTTLSDSVDAALEAMGLYPDEVIWDAWRRTDGKWVVCVAHPGLPDAAAATWTYDHAGRNLHPLDEYARRFMESGYASIEDFLGLEPDSTPEPETRPRLVAVDGLPTELEEAEPASISPGWSANGSLSRQPTVALNREGGNARAERTSRTSATSAANPSAPIAPGQPTPSVVVPTRPAPTNAPPTSAPRTGAAPTGAAQTAKSRPKGKSRRASVPSWDEILFGASKPEDR